MRENVKACFNTYTAVVTCIQENLWVKNLIICKYHIIHFYEFGSLDKFNLQFDCSSSMVSILKSHHSQSNKLLESKIIRCVLKKSVFRDLGVGIA